VREREREKENKRERKRDSESKRMPEKRETTTHLRLVVGKVDDAVGNDRVDDSVRHGKVFDLS